MSDPPDFVVTPDILPTCGRWVTYAPGCRQPTPVSASLEDIVRITARYGEAFARFLFGCAVRRKAIDYIGASQNGEAR